MRGLTERAITRYGSFISVREEKRTLNNEGQPEANRVRLHSFSLYPTPPYAETSHTPTWSSLIVTPPDWCCRRNGCRRATCFFRRCGEEHNRGAPTTKNKNQMRMKREKLDHTSQTHLLLNVVPVRERASDWGPKKGGDRINGAQQADLVPCSAAMTTTSDPPTRGSSIRP